MLYDKKWELDEVGKLLLAAADYMDEHGWCRARACDVMGRVCLMGALVGANPLTTEKTWEGKAVDIGFKPPVRKLHELATKQLAEQFDQSGTGYGIVAWNDNVCQSKEQAVAKLREAAYAAKTNVQT